MNLEASVEVWPTTYSARGWFEFDVLLIFSPFRIVADMLGRRAAIFAGNKELMGVDLAAHLEGPEPWFASGHASFKFFGLKVEFELEVGGQAGGRAAADRPPARPTSLAALRPAVLVVTKPARSTGSPPVSRTSRPTDDDPDVVWVRPDHQLMVRQSVAPLDRLLEIVGQAVPAADEELLHVTEAAIGDEPVTFTTSVDWFAPAQFEVLGHAEKLTRASFEQMNAGVTFGLATVTVYQPRRDQLTTSVDTGYEEDVPDRFGAHRPAAGIAPRAARPAATTAGGSRSPRPTYTLVRATDGTRGDARADRQRRGEWRDQPVRGDDGPGGTDRSGPRRAQHGWSSLPFRPPCSRLLDIEIGPLPGGCSSAWRPTTMTASLYFLPWLRARPRAPSSASATRARTRCPAARR